MRFKIWLIDKKGNFMVKTMTSASEDALLSRVIREDLMPVKLQPIKQSFFSARIKRKEIIEFCNSISLMVGGGISLLEALDEFALHVNNKRFRLIVEEISSDIRNGMSFSDALEKYNRVFPDAVVHLVKIGEETGTLSSVLKDAADHLQKIDNILSNTKRALMYPLFVTIAMFGAAAFWFFYVLPKLTKLFSTMQIKLPLPTVLLIKTVDFFNHYYLIFPAVLILIIATIVALKMNEKGRLFLDKMIYKMPIIGSLILSSHLAFFFGYEALLLRVGVPITNSLDIIQTAFKNLIFKNAIENINKNIKKGLGLSEAFRESKIFEPFIIRIIAASERAGEVDKQMNYISNLYYVKVNRMVAMMEKIIEPVVITVAGAFFFIIIIALILPVYQLVAQMGAMK